MDKEDFIALVLTVLSGCSLVLLGLVICLTMHSCDLQKHHVDYLEKQLKEKSQAVCEDMQV
jgi:hypothetical protein